MPHSPINLSDFRDSQVEMAEINPLPEFWRAVSRPLSSTQGAGPRRLWSYIPGRKCLLAPENPDASLSNSCPKTQNALSLERAKVRFRREARALANLGSHFQVPQLLDYFTTNGEFYLVQDYIEGETLAQEVRRRGRQKRSQRQAISAGNFASCSIYSPQSNYSSRH